MAVPAGATSRNYFLCWTTLSRVEDWAEIDARLNNRDNPLFDSVGENKFDALRQTVLRWERETQANRVNVNRVKN